MLATSPSPDGPATPTTKGKKRKAPATGSITESIAEEDSNTGGSGSGLKKKIKLDGNSSSSTPAPSATGEPEPDGPLLDEICGVSLIAPPLDPSSIPPPPLASEAGHATQDVCHNPLNCKIHSVPQKKAVAGRSMSFGYLLSRQNSQIKLNTPAPTATKRKASSSKKIDADASSDSSDSSNGGDDSDASDVSSSDDDDSLSPARLVRRRSTVSSREDELGWLPLPVHTRTRELVCGVATMSGRTWSRLQRQQLAARCWNLAALLGTSPQSTGMPVNTPPGANLTAIAIAERLASEKAREASYNKAKNARSGPPTGAHGSGPYAKSSFPPNSTSGSYANAGPSGSVSTGGPSSTPPNYTPERIQQLMKQGLWSTKHNCEIPPPDMKSKVSHNIHRRKGGMRSYYIVIGLAGLLSCFNMFISVFRFRLRSLAPPRVRPN